MNQLVMIPIDMIHPHPDNPRKDLGDLNDLSASIKESGLLQNLTVIEGSYQTEEEFNAEWRDELEMLVEQDPDIEFSPPQYDPHKATGAGFTVIIGHRRLAAARLAGLTEVPCAISDMDYKTQLATMLAENVQRSDLTPFEQAHGMQLMMDLGVSVAEIAERTGFAVGTIRRRLKIAELDMAKVRADADKMITLKDVERVAAIEDETEREQLTGLLGTNGFYFRIEQCENVQRSRKLCGKITAYFSEHYPELEKVYNSKIGKSQYNEYWSLKTEPFSSTGMEIPKGATVYAIDANNDGSAAYISFGGVNKKREKNENPEKEAEEKRRWEIAQNMRNYVNDIDKTAYAKRLAFVKKTVRGSVVLLKANAANTLKLLDSSFYEGLNWQSKKTFAAVVGADFEGKQYNEYNQIVYDCTWDMHPLATATAAVYSFLEPGDVGHHTLYNYNAGDIYKFERRAALDKCYEWLALLGYEKDEDELRMEEPDDYMFSFDHFAAEYGAARGGTD